MFVRDFVHVDRPMEVVRPRFMAGADEWLAPLASRAFAAHEELREQLAPTGRRGQACATECASKVLLEVGVVRLRDDALVLPLLWDVSFSAVPFPPLLADLEVAPIGSARTLIAFSGTYEPPRDGLGRRDDELLLHRLTEASVRSFLTEIARVLEGEREP